MVRGSDSGSDMRQENEVFELEDVDHEEFDSGSDSMKENSFATSKLVKDNVTESICGTKKDNYPEKNMTAKGEGLFVKAKFQILQTRTWEVIYLLLRLSEETIKPNDKITLNTLKDQLQKKFEVGVSKQKVFRAKKMAYERVVGSYSQQYAQLRDYCMELKERNPNTTVKIEVEPPEDPDIESESKDSWKWFLDCLGDDLEHLSKLQLPNLYLTAKGREKSNILLNNLCEVLNRQLLNGRDKPIITCLEYIKEYLMKRIVNDHKGADKIDGPLTPSTAKIFKLIVRAAAKLKLLPYGIQANNGIDTGIPI
ncbi:hypothetical protein Tco_0186161 [Tanacetum coccineum]